MDHSFPWPIEAIATHRHRHDGETARTASITKAPSRTKESRFLQEQQQQQQQQEEQNASIKPPIELGDVGFLVSPIDGNFTVSSNANSTNLNSTKEHDNNYNNTIDWEFSIPTLAPTVSIAPSAAPSMVPTAVPDGKISSTDSTVLRQTVQVYGTLYLVMTVLFCVFRKLYPKWYNIRSWVTDLKCDIAQTCLEEFGWISWFWKVFEIDEDDILAQCGMDALCLIRVLRIGRKLAIVGCVHALWLIPVYATAETSPETEYLTDRLVLISTANLPSESPRFLATVICAYIIFGYAMWLIREELQWYTAKRHMFLSQRRPRNYAVYVAGIPEEYRSDQKLQEFFQQSGATSSILQANVALSCPVLENLVNQRNGVEAQLKHARAYEELHGARAKRLMVNLGRGLPFSKSNLSSNNNTGSGRSGRSGGGGIVDVVDSIDDLELKLRQLTKDIVITYQDMMRRNDPLTLEQHREMVMMEMEERKTQERQQFIVHRSHDPGGHDLEHVEVTCHTAEMIKSSLHDTDRYSKAAEDFFLGFLSHSQARQQQQQQQAQQPRQQEQQSQQEEQKDVKRVSIHSSENLIHPISDDESLTPSCYDSESNDLYFDHTTNLRNLEFPGASPNGGSRMVTHRRRNPQSAYDSPSRSTITSTHGILSRYGESFQSNSVNEATDQLGQPEISETSDSTKTKLTWNHAIRTIGTAGKLVVNVGADAAKQAGNIGVNQIDSNLRFAAGMGVDNIKAIQASAAAVVPMVMARREGMPLEAGFVVFKDLYTTQAALQMLHHPVAGAMRVSTAPGPDEIYWKNVGLPGSAVRTGTLLSLTATVVLCLFWTVPVSFISALTEVNSLKQNIPALADVVEEYPAIENFLALLAPLLLLILQDVLLPIFLEWFAEWEGHISSSTMESAVFVKYAMFVLVQTFFVSAISGSIAAELKNMLDNPDHIIDFLAIALPAQSNYFLQILVVALVVTMGLEMLRVMPIGSAMARKFFGPNLTEEERRKPWKFLYPLESPRKFEHANSSGSVVLYFMVFFVYSCLAPISSFFLLFMFYLMEVGYRYQFYCNYPTRPDSGGQYWIGFFHILLGCLMVAELTLLGFLLLKQSFYAVPSLVPLLVFTCLFIYYLDHYKLFVANQLPTSLAIRVDKERLLNDYKFMKGVYVQPCIAAAQSDEIADAI